MADTDFEVLGFIQLQGEIREWGKRNFPDSGASEQFLGVVEEVGELAAAREVYDFTAINCHRPVKVAAECDERDAIGDISIYLLNYCNHREIDVAERLFRAGFDYDPILDFQESAYMLRNDNNMLRNDGSDHPFYLHPLYLVTMSVGKLAHANLKARQGIRGTEDQHRISEIRAVVELWVSLALYCEARGYCLGSIISETWAHVSKRDWIANPTNGVAS